MVIDNKFPFVLCILDGWGLAPSWGGNAITSAKTENFDYLWKNYPKTILAASGRSVGLPKGMAGNSEAGHLNIGAGRIVYQDQTVIDSEIKNGNFYKNPLFLKIFSEAKQKKETIHLIGLLSQAGTHSHIRHLFALLRLLKEIGLKQVSIHLSSDGRDSDPMSGIELMSEVENEIKKIGLGKISTITGRFYSMDRDNHWGRTARAYNVLVEGEGEKADNPLSVFSRSYSLGITDEFIEPKVIVNKKNQISLIENGDVIVFFNYRTDRIKQLIDTFLAEKIEQFPDRKKLRDLKIISFSMQNLRENYKNIFYPFHPDLVNYPLARLLSENNIKQFHIAETEKYAHITYFINGGREKPFPYEDRLLIPSPKVKTYDFTPHMSAEKVTSSLLSAIKKNSQRFFFVNFANPDMVGHSGNLKATMQAVSFVDKCLGKIHLFLKDKGGLLICSDHGNAEQMVNPSTGEPDTEHTQNPVPLIFVNKNVRKSITFAKSGALCNIAPTIIDYLNLKKPSEMNRQSLIIEKEK